MWKQTLDSNIGRPPIGSPQGSKETRLTSLHLPRSFPNRRGGLTPCLMETTSPSTALWRSIRHSACCALPTMLPSPLPAPLHSVPFNNAEDSVVQGIPALHRGRLGDSLPPSCSFTPPLPHTPSLPPPLSLLTPTPVLTPSSSSLPTSWLLLSLTTLT